jgi:hypothetical protein
METNNINQIRNAIKDPKAMIYVIASEELKKKIISGSDPLINSMPKEASQLFLEGKALAVENDMIVKWLDGHIDAKNKKVLDLCNIRVFRDAINLG